METHTMKLPLHRFSADVNDRRESGALQTHWRLLGTMHLSTGDSALQLHGWRLVAVASTLQ